MSVNCAGVELKTETTMGENTSCSVGVLVLVWFVGFMRHAVVSWMETSSSYRVSVNWWLYERYLREYWVCYWSTFLCSVPRSLHVGLHPAATDAAVEGDRNFQLLPLYRGSDWFLRLVSEFPQNRLLTLPVFLRISKFKKTFLFIFLRGFIRALQRHRNRVYETPQFYFIGCKGHHDILKGDCLFLCVIINVNVVAICRCKCSFMSDEFVYIGAMVC